MDVRRCTPRISTAFLLTALVGCGGTSDSQSAASATVASEPREPATGAVTDDSLRLPVPEHGENIDDGVVEAARQFAIRLATPALKVPGAADFPVETICCERLAFMHTSTGGKMDHWLVDGTVTTDGIRRPQWRMVIARLDDSYIPVTVSLNGVEIYHLRSHSQLLSDVRQTEIEQRQLQTDAAKAEELAAKRAVWKELEATKPAEQKAEAALKLATSLLDAGRIDPARKRLQEVIDKFPGTLAAAQAANLLDKNRGDSAEE